MNAELIGVPAAIASMAIGLPQLYRLLVRRDSAGVSVLTWWLTLCAGATWVAHNLRHGEVAAAVANGWSALTAAGIVYRCYADTRDQPFAVAGVVLGAVCVADAIAAVTMPDALGWIAAVIGMVMFVPQVKQVLTRATSTGVSVGTWCLAIVASLLWAVYGVLHDDPAVVAPPVLTGSSALIIVVRVLAQRRRAHDPGLG